MSDSVPDYECDDRLPPRLFATDRFPVNPINVYSKPDTLTFLLDVLRGSPELETILNSPFRHLFELPAVRCPISCKLIHTLLTRQVFPEDYDPDFQGQADVVPDDYWRELIGNDPKTTLADIGYMLRTDPDMPTSRRLRLALLIIVDGVLVANTQIHKLTPRYVRMLEDLDAFLSFPWGRESFLKTIACMRPSKKVPGKVDDPVTAFRQLLHQSTFRMQGFPLVLQLVAFEAIPSLPLKLPNDSAHPTLLEWNAVKLRKNDSLSIRDVLDVEFADNLIVHPLIEVHTPDVIGWGEWDDEIRDRKVDYLMELVSKRHSFIKNVWPGGDASEPLRIHVPTPVQSVHRRHIVDRKKKHSQPHTPSKLRPRKKLTKHVSRRKQKTIDEYCVRREVQCENQNEWLLSQVKQLVLRVQKLEDKVRARKPVRFGKLSSQRLNSTRQKSRRQQK
ncbi:uncharacterized protein LOC112088464 [Eutrema salsugineum]|uniref:uncharacterized protein LOC112088464 n=1 Tax=Eutrema salsugineum TaxID=72664 RepID=UPI000CECFE50|nr:uncharacterized protein LOC112088464 [Eutrema salsugineum]